MKFSKFTLDKRAIYAIILLLLASLSFFLVSEIATSPTVHASTIEKIDEKKVEVLAITASAATTATALALLPSDATTPIANQILDISKYLTLAVGAIYLEKILLTLTCYLAFKWLIPIACILGIAFLYLRKNFFKNLAIKLSVLGIILFMVVPVSVQVVSIIDNTFDTKAVLEATHETTISDEDANETASFWDKIKNTASSVTDKAKNILNAFIDAVVILVITSCVIPILVLMLFAWIIKMMIGIDFTSSAKKFLKEKKESSKAHCKKELEENTI